MTHDEKWLPIPGFDGWYEVSDKGHVRSYHDPAGGRREVPRPIGGGLRAGYPSVHLTEPSGRQIQKGIHQVLMLAFVGPRPTGHQVRHLDGDRLNCTLENLKYGTHQENVDDRTRHGTWSSGSVIKTHCVHGHPFNEENTKLRARRDGSLHRTCLTCRAISNERRRKGPRVYPRPTHCQQGHEYTPENTYTGPNRRRTCRTCMRQWKDAYRERRRAEKEAS